MVIDACRICDNRTLLPVLDLGPSALTGVFPATPEQQVPTVPLELVMCSPDGCGLLQLRHTADLGLMYGEHYGYRSGIRPFMIEHLRGKVAAITDLVDLGPDDLVAGHRQQRLHPARAATPATVPTLVGIDPSGREVPRLLPAGRRADHRLLLPGGLHRKVRHRRAKAVTSIAMFYDLPRPLDFMQDVARRPRRRRRVGDGAELSAGDARGHRL